MKTPERILLRRAGLFAANFEQISHFFSVFIVDFEQVNAKWVGDLTKPLQDSGNPFPTTSSLNTI